MPGRQRGNNYRKRGGRIPQKRFASLDCFLGRFLINRSNPWAEKDKHFNANEEGHNITVVVPNTFNQRYPAYMRLSYLTVEELDKLEELFRKAFELARPVVEERDRVAAEAASEGDMSYSRTWRQAPKLIVRDNAEELAEQIRRREAQWAAADAEGLPRPEDSDPDEEQKEA